MDPPSPSSNGNGCGGHGVSVTPKYSTFNTFLWYFFQTITISSILLMVLTIYYAFASSTNIRVVCVITISFGIITPSFIIPKLPQIAIFALPVIWFNTTFCIRFLNIIGWMYCGYEYPFPLYLSCYSLMVVVGLLKLYYSDGAGPNLFKAMEIICEDALAPCLFIFNNEIRYGTGRWVDSGAGWALLGLIVVTLLAYCLPPLVEPGKVKMMNIDEIIAISTEVASEKEKKMNAIPEVATPGSGSGTETFETTEVASEKEKKMNATEETTTGSGTKTFETV